jgi:poly[(R)-3-hydroxyalkanoate] polymerase subunit PhaC
MWRTLSPVDAVTRVNREVERAILRSRYGIRGPGGAQGPKVGATPKDVVWRRDKAELWRYQGGPIRYDPPLVFVHSLVSRSYILDLRPGSSAVEFFLQQGFDVFMVDWGVPDELDAENTLETYVDEYLPRAIRAVQRATGQEEVTLAGYCLGGTFAILYAAGPEARLRNLVLMASPGDYDAMGVMVAAVRDGRLDVDELVDETGNVPANALYAGFYMQAPTKQIAQYATLLDNLENDRFVEGYQAMSQWSRDHVPFPGAALRQIVDLFVRKNSLMSGRVSLEGRTVELTAVRADVLNAFAERDNVVPVDAIEPLTALVGQPSRRTELRLGGGHVTFATGSQAFKHTLPSIAGWIAERSDELDPPRER